MKISVCIASYNGSSYIEEQIKSILKQIQVDDEIVVCDDCSVDDTLTKLYSLNDPRIKVVVNNFNIGHVKNFEKCIGFASGDIIMLSDQDDLWLPFKCDRIRKIFDKSPDICFVHHSISILQPELFYTKFNILKSQKPNRFNFFVEQFFIPNVWGCAVAFRQEMVKVIIPFPKDVYAHDHWIGLLAPLYGRVETSSDSLILRRIHENNLTKKGNPFIKKLINRLKLLKLAFIALFRCSVNIFRKIVHG